LKTLATARGNAVAEADLILAAIGGNRDREDSLAGGILIAETLHDIRCLRRMLSEPAK
jgi:hypothetical protein